MAFEFVVTKNTQNRDNSKQEVNQMNLRKKLGFCLMVMFTAFALAAPSISMGESSKGSGE